MKFTRNHQRKLLTLISAIAGMAIVGVGIASVFDYYQEEQIKTDAYNKASSELLNELELEHDAPVVDGIGFEMEWIIATVQTQELQEPEISTKEFGDCNVAISYEKEFENRYLWHDWKMNFVSWEECNPDVRTMILMIYSNLVDERLLVLDPPVTKTYSSFIIDNWNGDELWFSMELYSDGYRIIEFSTKENGRQLASFDGDESDPTKEELCLIHEIDITSDGSCMMRIALEKIDALEEYHATPGNPRAEFGSGELIPEPGDECDVICEYDRNHQS